MFKGATGTRGLGRRCGRRLRGLTLIELIIVILLLGVLFSFSVFSISGIAPIYRVRSASRSLGALIEELRALAISRGRPLGIRYTLLDDPHYYQLIHPPPDDSPDEPVEDRQLGAKTELPPGVRIRRIALPGGRPVDHGAVNILFSPLGNSGSHVVTFEGKGRDGAPILLSLKFNAITGLIDFSEGEAAFEHHEG